ncbi:MAG: cation transporter, partial [Pseudomonas sp.]
VWLDPVMGIVGAIVIAKWAYGLMRTSAAVLLDTTDEHVAAEIRELLESSGDVHISDLHVWQVGPEARAAIVSVVAAAGVSTDNVRERLAPVHELSHLTVEYRNA